MMTFDRVIPEVLRVCEENSETHEAITRYCVIRDVRGRVRLVVDSTKGTLADFSGLEAKLSSALGKYFVGPVVQASAGPEVQRLAVKLMERAKDGWPTGWPLEYSNVLGGANKPIAVGSRWVGIERTIGKEAWLTVAPPKPPWPLVVGKTPPIVTFHSFKGGVGRTTLVGAYAMHLAKQRRRVAVLDLDLEAPGLSSLLGVSTERGVLDVLVDYIATGEVNLEGASGPADLGDSGDCPITVFPAGPINGDYVHKLARLDFSSSEPGRDNVVGDGLGAMLSSMRPKFDAILIDSRAGLHDLAGMSLHGLAHIDVLIFRGTTQHLLGLGETLRTLGSRMSVRLVLVETLLPPADDLLRPRLERSRDYVYNLLLEHVYRDNPPQAEDRGTPHDVVGVRRKEWLDGIDSLTARVDNILHDAELGVLASRIQEECRLGGTDEGDSDEVEVDHDSA